MPNLYPEGCITPTALHALAAALNRLHGWHMRIAQAYIKDEPCLRLIHTDNTDKVTAIVTYANQTWTLIYREGDWVYVGDNAIC